MFRSDHIPMLLGRVTFALVKEEAGRLARVAHVAGVIDPCPVPLLLELGTCIADLVTATRDAAEGEAADRAVRAVRDDVTQVTVCVPAGLQRVHLRLTPDAPLLGTLEDVRLGPLTLKRNEDAKTGRVWIAATILLDVALDRGVHLDLLSHCFGETLHVTFVGQQRELAFDVASPTADGTVTISTHGHEPVTLTDAQFQAAARRVGRRRSSPSNDA